MESAGREMKEGESEEGWQHSEVFSTILQHCVVM